MNLIMAKNNFKNIRNRFVTFKENNLKYEDEYKLDDFKNVNFEKEDEIILNLTVTITSTFLTFQLKDKKPDSDFLINNNLKYVGLVNAGMTCYMNSYL